MMEKDISHTFTDSLRKKFIELGFPKSTSGQLSKTILPFKIDPIEKKVFARCDNFFYLEQIIKPYYEEIHDIVKKCWGDNFAFEIDNSMDAHLHEKHIDTNASHSQISSHYSELDIHARVNGNDLFESETYISHFNFKNFISCESNEAALSACQYIAKSTGKFLEPVFIYGPTGVGKTHLLHAIGNELYQKNKHIRIMYITAHDFINEVIKNIRLGKMEDVRKKYKFFDVLLIDDIQILEKKTVCQAEFFHIINTILQRKKQLIVTANKSPKDLKHMDASLISRLLQGAMLEIQLPNLNDRITILQKKSKSLNLNLSNQIISFMAPILKTNIREIEGILTDIAFKANTIKNLSLSKTNIAAAIKERFSTTTVKKLEIIELQNTVCRYFNIELDLLKGQQRQKTVLLARHIAIYLAKTMFGFNTLEIAHAFDRKHSKIIFYAIKKITTQLKTTPAIKEHIDHLQKQLL